jgi:hypothetical protein
MAQRANYRPVGTSFTYPRFPYICLYMFKVLSLLSFIFLLSIIANAQGYTPIIEPCPCLMKVDARLKSVCGYLVVPESRQKPTANKVKIPFIFARRPDQDSSKNITLYTTGGPGYATIPVGDSLRYNSDRFAFGGFIFFDQRGTKTRFPASIAKALMKPLKTPTSMTFPPIALSRLL